MIRTLRPTDIVAYLAFRNKALQNVALDFPSNEVHRTDLKSFLGRSLSLDPRRESWIDTQDGAIHGLVSVKTRIGTDYWDIDQLVASSELHEFAYPELLRHISSVASEEGVQKIFLRTYPLTAASIAARQAGFFEYTTEQVYAYSGPGAGQDHGWDASRDNQRSLRTRLRADHHNIFQLYCSVVPITVRQVEGMTMQEWRWTEGWGLRPANWRVALPRVRHDFVLEGDDLLAAWLQVRPRTRWIIPLLRAEDRDVAEAVLRFGMSQLGDSGPIYVTVRHYQHFLGPSLDRLGFELLAEHVLLVKILSIRVAEPRLIAVRAHASR
jgi:hypothetical protein